MCLSDLSKNAWQFLGVGSARRSVERYARVCVCIFIMTSPTAVYNLPTQANTYSHLFVAFFHSISCTMEQKSRICHSLPTVQSKPSLFLGGTLPQEVPSPNHASCAAALIMGHYERQRHNKSATYKIPYLAYCACALYRGPPLRESAAPRPVESEDSEATPLAAHDLSSNYGTKPGPGDG